MVGHTGVTHTLSRLLAHFYWKTIRKDVQDFIAKCSVCQQTKIPTQRTLGLLQPIPPPSRCWKDLSLDFIVSLPSYKGLTTILVVVNRFSKGAHFGMLPRSFTALSVVELFINIVCNIMASLIASFRIAIRFSSKLQKRYFGPFQITNKIGKVAYELALPTTTKIHNVFHVCFLRPHKGPLPSSPLQLPSEIHDNQPILEPTTIIDWKRVSSSTDSRILVLVQWQGMPLEEASWEPQFKDQFHLEDKVLLELGRDVRISNPIYHELCWCNH